jgi:tetratricopeptide (TPR) repeat protein
VTDNISDKNMAANMELTNWLETEGNIHLKKALKLSKEESKYDPETEPYKSKYAAREILLNIRNKLSSLNVDESDDLRLKSIKSVVDYELGLNYIETDEVSTGERYITSINEEFEELKLKPEFCTVMIKCLQQLGMLWNERGDSEKSLSYFSKAERLYDEYKMVCEVAPFDTNM